LSKIELIDQLKEKNPKLNKSEINKILESFLRGIISALKKGNSVELRNFGKLYLKRIKENFNARNPRTKELIYKPERVRLRFKASNALKKFINK
jgi:nucleoid DNA-binding protein|tara:strand:+ start:2317 stop:2598 length:282 start_codon:yes stop_codon:yes gene_type:complete